MAVIRKRVWFLTVGFVLFIVLAYHVSFAEVWTLAGRVEALEAKKIGLHENENEFPLIKRKMENLKSRWHSTDSSDVRHHLTAFITSFSMANSCAVVEIPEGQNSTKDKLRIQRNSFTIRGEFVALARLLHFLETTQNHIAHPVSARYWIGKEAATRKPYLCLTINLQSMYSAP